MTEEELREPFPPYSGHMMPVSVKGITLHDERVWLRHNERDEWELPGGRMDRGEQPEQTLFREILEELGYESVIGSLVSADLYIPASLVRLRGVLVISYLCRLTRQVAPMELMGEAGPAQFRQFTLREIGELKMPSFYKAAIFHAAAMSNAMTGD